MTYIPTPSSSHIAGYEYIAKSADLVVTFKRNGHQYVYHNVPANVASGFENSSSKSKYFVQYIKTKYLFTRVK